ANTTRFRQKLLHELDALARHLRHEADQACHVASGPSPALDPPTLLRIAAHRHDDRDGLRRPKGRVDGVATHRHDHVDIRSHKVRSQCRESLRIALRTANLNQKVLAYRPPKLAESE